jgi:hypothetical protein
MLTPGKSQAATAIAKVANNQFTNILDMKVFYHLAKPTASSNLMDRRRETPSRPMVTP